MNISSRIKLIVNQTRNKLQNFITVYETIFTVLILCAVMVICEISIALAVPTLNLTANNLTPSPGDTVIFSTNIVGTNVHTVFTDENIINMEDEQDLPPYTWDLQIPQTAAGSKYFKVYAIVDGQNMESNEVKVTVVPDMSDLQQLAFEPGDPLYMIPGSTQQLHIVGYFTDVSRVLTEGAVGTIYSENIVDGLNVTPGDSPSIKVTIDGMVTAQAPGTAEVVATNNGKTATIRVFVGKVSEEDSDGDGLKDTDEETIGTDKYNPDTDQDYCKDGIEVGSDTTNPRDVNNDGIIDALDSQTLVVQDEIGQAVSIRTSSGKISSAYSQETDSLKERLGELSSVQMERGVFGFTVSELLSGESIDVTLYFESLPLGTNTYLKYGPQLSENVYKSLWYEFANMSITGNNITLHLTDNQTGDANLSPGIISDPGGPGIGGDTTPPTVNITIPSAGTAVQDGVTLTSNASDISGVASLSFYIREPGDTTGIPIGQENLAGILANGTSENGTWEHSFDTTTLQDGYYVILAQAIDSYGNIGWSEVVNFSIRNWAVVELLPASENNKAGRTMPIKFSLRISGSVDPSMPFVYNEGLEIKVFQASKPGNILQTSYYGDSSRDYRINGEKYITNYKTTKKPAEYMVEIWRTSKNWEVGSFMFETVK
ncbi:choice-of-anchor U domain-containing protein [Thermodesulfobacteriota bacterium]